MKDFYFYGEDKRIEYIKNRFVEKYNVLEDKININDNTIIILPPPVTKDTISKLLPYIKSQTVIIGGAIREDAKELIHSNRYYDYLDDENTVNKNAILTAKGLIDDIICDCNIDNNIIMFGYGRCGKAICKLLNSMGKHITIAVRNEALSKEIEDTNNRYINIKDFNKLSYDNNTVLINTIPALIIDKSIIDNMNDPIIYDIASKPGGVDFTYARQRGICAYQKLGIPGKKYPNEAGEIILEYIINIIKKR